MLGRLEVADEIVVLELRGEQEQRVEGCAEDGLTISRTPCHCVDVITGR